MELLKTFSKTDIGKKRKINQDYVYTSEQPIGNLSNVFIVADGMGGHAAGDLASKTAVETMIKEIEDCFEKNPSKIFKRAITTANEVVYKTAKEDPALNGMGTTVVAATFVGKYLQIANVGDSRLYVGNNRGIKQITVDHSLVEEMVRRGGIGRLEARNHPDKNIITRAVGVRSKVEPDFYTQELLPGDWVLLCSDGLTNMLEDEAIRRIVCSARDVAEAVEELVAKANEQGGKDNISVVLICPNWEQ